MPDAAPEVVFTGAAKPPSWGERLIRAHTPEAHYQDIMNKYFWVADRLEGPSLELALRLRPTVELAARAGGWSKTLMEGFYAGQATLFMAFLGYRGLKSAAGVFGEMARRRGGKAAEGAVALLTAGAGSAITSSREPASPAVPSSSSLEIGNGDDGKGKGQVHEHEIQAIREDDESPANDDGRFGGKPRKKKGMSAKARRNEDRRRRGIPVDDEDDVRDNSPTVRHLDENGIEPNSTVTHPPASSEVSMDHWETTYDRVIGTDPDDAVNKPAVVGLLQKMMMDTEVDGFRDGLAKALVEPNVAIRGKQLNALIAQAGEAFGADDDVLVRAQLLVEAATNHVRASK